jgi:hypothetical protein
MEYGIPSSVYIQLKNKLKAKEDFEAARTVLAMDNGEPTYR